MKSKLSPSRSRWPVLISAAVVFALAVLAGPAPAARLASAVVTPGSLWLGNDTGGLVFHTDTAGALVSPPVAAPVTGIAFDGANLFFSDAAGHTTRRTLDGVTVLGSFAVAPHGSPTEDLAWDSTRGRLWRVDHFPPTLVKINPVTGLEEAFYPLAIPDPVLGVRGALGVAYDSSRDKLYVSFCHAGCATLALGLVVVVDPATGGELGELFRTAGFATGGLGYDPLTDTLWVGDSVTERNMSLGGAVLSSFNKPGGAGFTDGLEFVPVDVLPPVVRCIETTNPSGNNVPNSGPNAGKSGQNPDGFYQLLARDLAPPPLTPDPDPQIFVADSASAFVSGPYHSGDKVKITQAPGGTPNDKPMAGVVVAHITLKGDALVYAVDALGNRSRPISCLVPPPPK